MCDSQDMHAYRKGKGTEGISVVTCTLLRGASQQEAHSCGVVSQSDILYHPLLLHSQAQKVAAITMQY